MKQTIEIEVPDGKKAVWKDDKIVFEDIKPKLPKTWIEFCRTYKSKGNEAFINVNSEIHKCYSIENPNFDRNVLPSKQAAEQHLALMQLHQLRDFYRQGWVPDWNDCYNKYGIKWDFLSLREKPIVVWCSHDPRFLSFPTYEIAEEFLTNFRDLIEQAGDLI